MALWIGFWALGLIWGSSFLLIKIGVQDFTPLQLIAIRIGLAAIAMLLSLRLTGQHFPKDRHSRLGIVIVGLFNTAIPFFLITWGEQSIPSGVATVLNATVPLFSLIIAHFALSDEKITGFKVLGLASGFIGIVILASRNLGEEGLGGSFAGQLAVLVAALCYAGATVYMRRNLRHLKPMVVSGGALLTASVATLSAALLIDGAPVLGDISAQSGVAVLVLGLLNTYVAYLIFYWIIDRWGATRATLVTYVMPPVGLTLGAIFLGEVVDVRLVVGAVLIVAGVALVNLRLRRGAASRPRPSRPAKGALPGAMPRSGPGGEMNA